MKLPGRFGAVIFDLDGTLADSMAVWEGVCGQWAREHKVELPADIDGQVARMTLEQSSRHIAALAGNSYIPGELLADWEAIVVGRYRRRVQPKPGATQLLEKIAKAGIPMALATSCFPAACAGFLEEHGFDRYFPAVVYTDETGKDKTHPEVYLECAKRMGVPANGCVVVEDLYASLAGVRRAGMAFAAVYDAYGSKDWDRLEREADVAVKSLMEFI